MENYDKSIEFFTLADLEKILKLSRRTLLKYVGDGRLKGVKIGNRWTVSRENLEKFINGE